MRLGDAMTKRYIYQRRDGEVTNCYGELRPDSRLEVYCRDHKYDTTYTDTRGLTNWTQACAYLEAHYNPQIEELVAR